MKSSAGQRRHQKDLDRGARIGAATGLPLMAAIYGLYAPTADIRVRIPFLLEMSGGLLIVLILLGFVAIEIVILASTRLLTRWGFTGVVAVSLAYVILLASGNVGRWLPQFNSMGARWGVLVCSIIVATVVIVRTSRAAAVSESAETELELPRFDGRLNKPDIQAGGVEWQYRKRDRRGGVG